MGERKFEDVQKEARDLGLKVHHKKQAQLEIEIAEARAEMEANTDSTPDESTESPSTQDEVSKSEERRLAELEKAKTEEAGKLAKEKAEAKAKVKAEEKARIAEAKKLEKKFNAVVIYNGKMQVRTYSKEVHKKDFALLAREFAEARKFKMVKVLVEDQIACPHCGNSFAPRS